MFAFVGENCPVSEENVSLEKEYEKYCESLDEINAMISHFKELENADEVAYWRRFLMRTKMQMREIKAKMMDANTMAKEIVYS